MKLRSGETNGITLNISPLLLLPQLYTLNMTSDGVGCPLGQLGSVVLAVPPPKPLCTPSLLPGGGGLGEAEKALALGKNCSAAEYFLSYLRNKDAMPGND